MAEFVEANRAAPNLVKKKMAVNEAMCQADPFGKSCPKGNWCCLDASDPKNPKSTCVPCQNTVSGHCAFETSSETCSKHGYKPWNSLSDLEDVAKETSESLIKAAAKQILCKYIPSECV
jgi:hypothetical protein